MTEPTVITIELRLPSQQCRPNKRGHWAVKARAKAADRYTAGVVAKAAMKGQKFGWTSATAQLTYTVNKTTHDRDNLLAWAKAFMDGIADAGIVINDNAITYPPVQVVIGNPQGLSITITKGPA